MPSQFAPAVCRSRFFRLIRAIMRQSSKGRTELKSPLRGIIVGTPHPSLRDLRNFQRARSVILLASACAEQPRHRGCWYVAQVESLQNLESLTIPIIL